MICHFHLLSLVGVLGTDRNEGKGGAGLSFCSICTNVDEGSRELWLGW